MRKHLKLFSLVLMLGVGLAACSTQEEIAPVPPPPDGVSLPIETELTEETLMQAWDAIPKEDRNTLDVTTASLIVNNLLFMGEENLSPLLERLGDPDGPPLEKVLIVISMEPYVRPSMAETLLAMTAPGRETTTRACATHLYGRLDLPEVDEHLKRLSNDDERRIRIAALFVRQLRGDAGVVDELKMLCFDGASQASEREQFVLGLPDAFAADHLDVFNRAIQDPELSSQVHLRSLNMIERLGDSASVEALTQALANDVLDEANVAKGQEVLAALQRLESDSPEEQAPANT